MKSHGPGEQRYKVGDRVKVGGVLGKVGTVSIGPILRETPMPGMTILGWAYYVDFDGYRNGSPLISQDDMVSLEDAEKFLIAHAEGRVS